MWFSRRNKQRTDERGSHEAHESQESHVARSRDNQLDGQLDARNLDADMTGRSSSDSQGASATDVSGTLDATRTPGRKDSTTQQPQALASNDDTVNGEDEAVNILRFLRPECIELSLQTEPSIPVEDETESQRERRLVRDKEAVLSEITDILDRSGEIANPTKFYKDLVNRERKATTAIAPGIAIPHVRTMQARSFVIGFARAPGDGLPFASLDGAPTRLFFMLTSPPYEDKTYLKVYRQFAEMISQPWVVDSFLEAESPQDILNVLRGYIHN